MKIEVFTVVSFCLLATESVTQVAAKDFYCLGVGTEAYIKGETSGKIFTVREGQTYYPNNDKCVFRYEAPVNHRVQLKVDYSNLQWSPDKSICDGYDHVEVKDGRGTLVSWCGKHFPREIISRDNYVDIIFKSDESNPRNHFYRGAGISFKSYDKLSCPPEWLTLADTCYTSTALIENWSASQKDCNLRQGNLLTVKSEEEFNFVSDKILTASSESFLWTGLNDIAQNGVLKWIDLSDFKSLTSLDTPKISKYENCGALSTSQRQLFMEECDHHEYIAVCQASLVNATTIYSIPQPRRNKGDDDDNNGRALKITAIVVIPVLAVALIIAAIYFRKRRGRRETREEVELKS